MKKTRKLERAVGGSALKYFLTFEIKISSEDFTCKKHSMALSVTSVFIRQAPNTNSKTYLEIKALPINTEKVRWSSPFPNTFFDQKKSVFFLSLLKQSVHTFIFTQQKYWKKPRVRH